MLNAEFSSKSKSFLRKAEKLIEERILGKIEGLRADPFPNGAETVKGKDGKVLRVRVGDYRIVYKVFLKENAIVISNIGKRENVYN